MRSNRMYPAEMSTQSLGKLSVNTVTQLGYKPVTNAKNNHKKNHTW